jgi:hypothetical protein
MDRLLAVHLEHAVESVRLEVIGQLSGNILGRRTDNLGNGETSVTNEIAFRRIQQVIVATAHVKHTHLHTAEDVLIEHITLCA